ncbi:MAG: outer membrane beta-barrel domain-containing protein [Myxococcota bacterium]
MRARHLLWVLVLASPPSVWAQSSADEAGDVSEIDKDSLGPLRERVRPVSGHLFLKKGRFELSPGATVSVKDAFYTKYILGASLTFHPFETFGIGARVGYSIPVVSGAAQICESGAGGGVRGCRLPTPAELDRRALGQIQLTGGVDAQWAPLYGKIALVAERFLSFDMYGIAGGSVVQYRGPNGDTMTVGGDLGLGMRFFINKWMTVRTELRDLVYVEDAEGGGSSLRNQILVDFGLSFFLPTTFKEG